METLLTLTLFGSLVWAIVSVAIFLLILFASETQQNGFVAFGSLLGFLALYYFFGSFSPFLVLFSWKVILSYFVIGLIYSSIRTFFEGRKLGEKMKKYPDTKPDSYPYESKQSLKDEFVKKLKGNVFRWWFMWPISLITWLLTDLIKDVWNYLYSKVKRFYDYILDLGIKSIK